MNFRGKRDFKMKPGQGQLNLKKKILLNFKVA